MNWLNKIVDEIIEKHPEGEVIVSSGVSPSGTYHLGTLREVLTAEVISRELKYRGRKCRHIHIVDDLDVLRKVPVEVDKKFEKHLGKPLCDIPAPDGSDKSYADYFLSGLLEATKGLNLDMEIIRAHKKYREGFFAPAIEKALEATPAIRKILETISGHKLDEQWTPVQVMEEGYLKNRSFVSIDTGRKEIIYLDVKQQQQTIDYAKGEVKLNWRIDWPARWWLLGVDAEPFGRDHATKGGSYDTGIKIAKDVFKINAPLPIPYNFINRTGDTKKMSKSSGGTINASELLKVLPPEIVWYFILRSSPDKLLFFDQGQTLMHLVDEFSELTAKENKSEKEEQLLRLSTHGIKEKTISRIPFSHLVASYQAALHNIDKTLDIIQRTEHGKTVKDDEKVIRRELIYTHEWLDRWAPEEVKFNIEKHPNYFKDFDEKQVKFLKLLSNKIEKAPKNADGEWFHKAIYDLKDVAGLDPKEMFKILYKVLINKTAGPRAGWFLSLLDRDWLIKRLKLEQ